MHRLNSLAAGVLLAATAALAGCASGPSTKTFHTTLNGSQEVPPTKTNGTGNADLTLDPASKQLTWKVNYSDLTSGATAAHIHGPAASGANAGVMVNLAPTGMKNPLEGSTTLTDAQIADLMAGKYYVNIHTPQNKAGEIRGQITP